MVSLGRMSFEYLGNDTQIVESLAEAYNLKVLDAKNYLNFLAFDIKINIGHNVHLWKCEKCGKVTQSTQLLLL